MNSFEQIFRITLTLEEKEKLRILTWLYRYGQRLVKLGKEFGEDPVELKEINQALGEFIKNL